MSKQKKNDQQKVKNLQDAVKRKLARDDYKLSKVYILDDENAIALVGRYRYNVMIHYMMSYGNLFEVTFTPMRNVHGRQLKKHKLFMLMEDNYANRCVAIYDYEHGQFIVKNGMFDNIGYDATMNIIDQHTPCIDYLKQHNCFLAYFNLMSDGRTLSEQLEFTSLINGFSYFYDFEPPKETYYAFVNLDGTIRGNSLFKGEHLSKIEQVIDLGQYGSLEEFKTQRRNKLNEIGKQSKQAYYDRVGTGHWENPSPYLDEEVIKVMSLSK